MTDTDIGVPGAVAEALRRLGERIPPERLDRIWIFPPLASGRRESGVLAAGCFVERDRRLLVTMAYRAEESGRGVTFQSTYQEEGEAPLDRLPRVMEGVVERSETGLGGPRSIRLEGDPERFRALVVEWSPRPDDNRFRVMFEGGVESPRRVDSTEEAPA